MTAKPSDHLHALLDQKFSRGQQSYRLQQAHAPRGGASGGRSPFASFLQSQERYGLSALFQGMWDGGGGDDIMGDFLGSGGKSGGGMEAGLDQMIAKSLVQGPQTSNVLSSLFGLTPNLIGR